MVGRKDLSAFLFTGPDGVDSVYAQMAGVSIETVTKGTSAFRSIRGDKEKHNKIRAPT